MESFCLYREEGAFLKTLIGYNNSRFATPVAYFDRPLVYQKAKIMKITLTGSLGHIGKPLTASLVQRTFHHCDQQ